jgi:predicted anti-sigma-YlaC factor YlaD
MNCREAERLIDALLDGDIAGSPRLAQHLGACPTCRELHAALRATMGDLAAVVTPESAADLTARVMAAVAPAARGSSARRMGLALAAISLSAASAVLTVLLLRAGLGDWLLTVALGVGRGVVSVAAALAGSVGWGTPGFAVGAIIYSFVAGIGVTCTASIARICAVAVAGRRKDVTQ